MASVSLRQKYKWLIRRLFPTGWVWKFSKDSTLLKLTDSLAEEPARVEERALVLLEELDPSTSFELLDSWERFLGLPDECDPDDLEISIFERRVRLLQKLTTGGGQSKAFFKLIAKQLGYDADVIDVVNFKDFRAGIARAGDPLTNSTNVDGTTNDSGWAYTFQVKAPAELVRRFRAGQSTAGERLNYVENRRLECVIRKFAPAHVTVIFSFGE